MALFALALQLVLSFGHLHLDGDGSTHAFVLIGVQAPVDATDAAPSPKDPEPGGAAHHDCPLCTLIQLAGSLVPAEAPILPLPTVSGRLPVDSRLEVGLAASPRGLFFARAPPVA